MFNKTNKKNYYTQKNHAIGKITSFHRWNIINTSHRLYAIRSKHKIKKSIEFDSSAFSRVFPERVKFRGSAPALSAWTVSGTSRYLTIYERDADIAWLRDRSRVATFLMNILNILRKIYKRTESEIYFVRCHLKPFTVSTLLRRTRKILYPLIIVIFFGKISNLLYYEFSLTYAITYQTFYKLA